MFDNFKILTQYSFIVVALGTSLLAIRLTKASI